MADAEQMETPLREEKVIRAKNSQDLSSSAAVAAFSASVQVVQLSLISVDNE